MPVVEVYELLEDVLPLQSDTPVQEVHVGHVDAIVLIGHGLFHFELRLLREVQFGAEVDGLAACQVAQDTLVALLPERHILTVLLRVQIS